MIYCPFNIVRGRFIFFFFSNTSHRILIKCALEFGDFLNLNATGHAYAPKLNKSH